MKILIAHTAYQQRGGEDAVFDNECALLEAAGHSVSRLTFRNDHIVGWLAKARAALSVVHNPVSVSRFKEALDAFAPDIVHIHNYFPTLSPSAIECAVKRNIPVVVTLHNYRPLCVGAMLTRCGKPCEACLGKTRIPGIIHRCYRGSLVGSFFSSRIGPYLKKLIAKYPKHITLVALTSFAKAKFVADGFPESSIVVKGNYLPDKGPGHSERENKIVFVGRLSPEKGVDTLLAAMKELGARLEIIGDGPDRQRLEALNNCGAVFLGKIEPEAALAHIKSARAMAIPSRWYEGFPMVVLEAMSTGTPVIASNIGSLSEIIRSEETGLLVDPYDDDLWKNALSKLLATSNKASALGQRGREEYLAHYSGDVCIKQLIRLYEDALRKRGA